MPSRTLVGTGPHGERLALTILTQPNYIELTLDNDTLPLFTNRGDFLKALAGCQRCSTYSFGCGATPNSQPTLRRHFAHKTGEADVKLCTGQNQNSGRTATLCTFTLQDIRTLFDWLHAHLKEEQQHV